MNKSEFSITENKFLEISLYKKTAKSFLFGGHLSALKTVAALLFLILTLTSFSFAQSNAVKAKRAYDQAIVFFGQDSAQSWQKAVDYFEQARALYQNAGDDEGEALSLFRMGQTYKKLNNLAEAYKSYTASYEIYNRIGDEAKKVFAAQNIAAVLRDAGQFNDAIQIYQNNVFPQVKTHGSRKDIARAYNGLADCYRNTGNLEKALGNYQQSLDYWRLVKENDEDKIRATYGIASTFYQLGNTSEATKFASEALRLARINNDPVFEVEVLEALAQVYDDAGAKTQAVEHRKRALDVYKNAGRGKVSDLAYDGVINNLGDVLYRMGNLDEANSYLQKGIRPGADGRQYPGQSYIFGTIGEVYTAQGKYEEAVKMFEKAIQLAQQAGDKHSEAYNLTSLGAAYFGIAGATDQDFSRAFNALEKALEFFPSGQNPAVEGKAISGMILLASITGQKQSAGQYIERAKNNNLDQGNSIPAIQITKAIGQFYTLDGQHEEAMNYYKKAYRITQARNNLSEGLAILSSINFSLMQTGRYKEALDGYKILRTAYKSFGNKYNEANAVVQSGWANLNLRQNREAFNDASAAVALARQTNNQRFVLNIQINASHLAGKANFNENQFGQALGFFQESLAIAEQFGDKAGQKHFLEDIALTYEALGDKKAAKDARKKAKKI